MNTSLDVPVLDILLLQHLGSRLKQARKAQGLTMEALSRRIGISRNTLRAIELGDPGTSIGHYLGAMSVLGLRESFRLFAGGPASVTQGLQAPEQPAVSSGKSRSIVQIEFRMGKRRAGHVHIAGHSLVADRQPR